MTVESVKSFEVDIPFVRESRCQEEGYVTLKMKNPNDMNELKKMCDNEDFYQFLVNKRSYDGMVWTFGKELEGSNDA